MVKTDLTEAQPINNSKFAYMALLQTPVNNVVQAFSLNNIDDFYQYSLQLSDDSLLISKSANMSTYDWEYNSGDGRTIKLDKFISLSTPFVGHSQTLIQNGGNIITGLFSPSFSNLSALLEKASQVEDGKFITDFYKDNTDTASWDMFETWKKHPITGVTSSNGKIDWSIDFIGLPNQRRNTPLIDGQYVNLVGARKLLDDVAPYRTELVSSPNNQYCMLAVVDTDYTLHFYKFKLNILDLVNLNHGEIYSELAAHWNGTGFPTVSNVGNNIARLKEALDFYQAILNSDALVIDFSQYPYEHISYKQSDVLEITKTPFSHLSYQGYGLDKSGSIYICSGFYPDSDHAESKPYLYKIPYDEKTNSYGRWEKLACFDEFVKPVDGNPVVPSFIEPEGIQVLNDNNVLMTVSYHSVVPSHTTMFTRVYRAKWSKQ